jgi:hypothetical protein
MSHRQGADPLIESNREQRPLYRRLARGARPRAAGKKLAAIDVAERQSSRRRGSAITSV